MSVQVEFERLRTRMVRTPAIAAALGLDLETAEAMRRHFSGAHHNGSKHDGEYFGDRVCDPPERCQVCRKRVNRMIGSVCRVCFLTGERP